MLSNLLEATHLSDKHGLSNCCLLNQHMSYNVLAQRSRDAWRLLCILCPLLLQGQVLVGGLGYNRHLHVRLLPVAPSQGSICLAHFCPYSPEESGVGQGRGRGCLWPEWQFCGIYHFLSRWSQGFPTGRLHRQGGVAKEASEALAQSREEGDEQQGQRAERPGTQP